MSHQAQDTLLSKLRLSARIACQHLPAPLPGLFILTDPVRLPDAVALAPHLFAGSGLIYRHFGADNRHEVARALALLSREKGFVLLIGNDGPLAQSVGAHGVHWPEKQLDEAKRWTGAFEIMTAAAHSKSAIMKAHMAGLDAALVSTIFPSSSPSATAPIGPKTLADWTSETGMPTYGLGGVNADNFETIRHFSGAAMIGAAQPLAALELES